MEAASEPFLFIQRRGFEMSERDAYKQKIEAEIELAHAKLLELKAHAKNVAADVRIKYEGKIADLESMLDATKSKLGELGASSGDAWVELKGGVEAAWGAFTTGLGNAAAKFKK